MKNFIFATSMVLGSFFVILEQSYATYFELKFGPPGAGIGGTNPVGIPPSIADTEISWISDSHTQFTFSLVPGILVGKRFKHEDFFGTVGGGLVINVNGAGVGPYVGLGYLKKLGNANFVVEFKHALGIWDEIISPYALRIGGGYGF